MKLTDDHLNWLDYVNSLSAFDNGASTERTRQECRRWGLTEWDRATRTWMVTPAGRSALSSQSKEG